MIDGLNRLIGCDPSKSFFWNTTLSQNLKEKASPYVDLESEKMAKEIVGALSDLVIKLTTFRSILPQGTPTAPFLFYLALLKSGLFSEIKAICPEFPKKQDKYYFRISAYVDGFVVSAKRPVPERNQALILRAVERAGFKVNPKKIRHQDVRHGNVLITGLRLTEKRPNIKIRKWPDLPFLPLRRVPVFPKRKIARWRGLIHRAIFQPDLRPKAQGIVAAVRSVYGTFLPPQIRKPYQLLLSRIKEEKQNARP